MYEDARTNEGRPDTGLQRRRCLHTRRMFAVIAHDGTCGGATQNYKESEEWLLWLLLEDKMSRTHRCLHVCKTPTSAEATCEQDSPSITSVRTERLWLFGKPKPWIQIQIRLIKFDPRVIFGVLSNLMPAKVLVFEQSLLMG